MSKIIKVAMLSLIVLSLTGCGEKDKPIEASSNSVVASETPNSSIVENELKVTGKAVFNRD